jgi:hypothetical protein
VHVPKLNNRTRNPAPHSLMRPPITDRVILFLGTTIYQLHYRSQNKGWVLAGKRVLGVEQYSTDKVLGLSDDRKALGVAALKCWNLVPRICVHSPEATRDRIHFTLYASDPASLYSFPGRQ